MNHLLADLALHLPGAGAAPETSDVKARIVIGCIALRGKENTVPSREQPPLFAKERNSLRLETFFPPTQEVIWERGRRFLSKEVPKRLVSDLYYFHASCVWCYSLHTLVCMAPPADSRLWLPVSAAIRRKSSI